MAPSEDQLMALFWVSARVVSQCSEVSEVRTDTIFMSEWLCFTWMLKWLGRKKCVDHMGKLVEIWPMRAMEGGEAEGKYNYRDKRGPVLGRVVLTQWGGGHLNCLNARSRCLNNLNQLLYCVYLKIYNKFANYFCELKVSGNTHQRP